MAENQTDASRYQSKYGGGWITVNNFIAEMICERIAAKDKIEALPVKFWSLPKWKKIYLTQLLMANSLLKIYSPQAIIGGLKRHPKVYSLRAEWLDDTFKEEQEKFNKLKQQAENSKNTTETLPAKTELVIEQPRESFSNNKSIKAKLRDLD